jgi:hypothetical protein
LFISHRDSRKAEAKFLASTLEGYGISAFVAHDTIEPMTTWQAEILKGLETMEIMLAFITDDFHESTWSNQEIGFALGRGVPIISLKLQRKDPSGFIGNQQALRGSLDDPAFSVPDIYKILATKLGNKGRLQSALITAFVDSPNFNETKVRFDRLDDVVDTLSKGEADQIALGFHNNDQLHNAGHLTSKYQRLQNFMKRTTGTDYGIEDRKLFPLRKDVDEEMPF